MTRRDRFAVRHLSHDERPLQAVNGCLSSLGITFRANRECGVSAANRLWLRALIQRLDEYMTSIVDPTLQWHMGSREPLSGWQAHLHFRALLLQGQKDRSVAISPAAADRLDHFLLTQGAQTHRRVGCAREFL